MTAITAKLTIFRQRLHCSVSTGTPKVKLVTTTRIQIEGRALSPVYRTLVGPVLLYVCAVCLSGLFPFPIHNDTALFLYRQDRWLLLIQCCLLLFACSRLGDRKDQLHSSERALWLVGLGLLALCYAGTKWLLFDYQLSRDEQMVVFDARIFGSGLLVQPLPKLWQSHAGALNTSFMLPVAHPVAWVSAYLPMNAALRTAVGWFADPSLTGPLMVALGLIFLWKCCRQLWPDDPEAALVAGLLYIGSGQVLLAGMTAYAMPAHLALNLLWLWMFLLNRRVTDLAALLAGFVATGLHQPLFHPLFAAPILFTLVRERNWPRVALFAVGYGAICAFWLAWPHWMHALVAGPNSTEAGGTDYITRLSMTLSKGDPLRWREVAANVLRFFAWQHILLLPLIVAGIAVARRERFAGALAFSLILSVCVMFLILPYQGHGFGYRYAHGVIGAAILLAVYGWRQVGAYRAWLRPLVMRTTLAGIIVLLPIQLWMGHSFYAPYARIGDRISTSGDDYVIVGETDAPYSHDLVINRPDLSNRPIRLFGEEMDGALIRNICRPGVRVGMPTGALLRPIEEYYVMPRSPKADARIANFSPRLNAAGCTVDRIGAP